ELNQIRVDLAKIALNLETVRQIGFDPPVDILLAADEVYEGRESASTWEK
ncbi:MAG: ABC transporter substrate-binding protein, partial [Candidatus Accumulibacter sp.]|nr:ABC transporter substrate-binding protein [Accumulibacter sp.]